MNLAQMRARLTAIEQERRDLHGAAGEAAFSDEQQTRWDALDTEETELREAVRAAEEAEARAARVAESRARWGSVQVDVRQDPFDLLARGAGATRQQLITANLRAIEGRVDNYDADTQRHLERLFKRHAGHTAWALNLLGRSRPEYEAGWAKLMMGRAELLTNEERAAIAVGTNTQGGYLVPTHLDPTLILTNSGSSNVIRSIARVTTLTMEQGNDWNGVTTAGVTASFDAELAEVSDDTPGFDPATVPLHWAQSLVQASIQAFGDIAGLQSDVMMLFADARDRLEGQMHATGSGAGQPTGIFTALDANTNVEIVSTTAATIGEVDIHSVYRQVPVRWRGRGTWLMNPLYNLAIKRLGTAVSSSFSGDLTQATTDRILNRPVVESDDAPTTQTTTANDNEIVFGDFQNFLIVDKPGSMAVEFIPHLFHTGNNLPKGVRGWYAHWRTGSDSINDLAFRLLQDKTSA